MTRPMIYQHATEDFETYLADACDRLDTPSRNVAYTATDGVFRAFRARLDPQDALRFSDALPAVLRAIFVAGWKLDDRRPWADREILTGEVKALRRHHNFSPDTVIADVAWAVRRHVDEKAFDAVLETLGEEARRFWAV
jgi:uncharacterized protein (DUF2267 family)